MAVLIKICGLTSEATLAAAIESGADMVGFVFFPPSPRALTLEAAAPLAAQARGRAKIVALTVDADDATLAAIEAAVAPDILQLHGRETPERAAAVRHRFGRPILKALGVATAADVAAASAYDDVVDHILFDARPPKDATRPGGNGVAFDWSLLRVHARPFFLSGGLHPDNVMDAYAAVMPYGVDVSSGVEQAPGVKDPARIAAFVARARAAATRNAA